MSLRGRVGVVTGAGRGIGREIARALAAEGMSLALVARTGSEVRELAEELRVEFDVRCFPAAVDVTDPTAIERLLMHIEQHLGALDLLVNNAGVIEESAVPFWEADLDDVWRVIETNLRGPLLMTRAVLPAMVDRGRGHVVNVTSRARSARQGGIYTGYALSKTGLSALTETLSLSLAGTGVVVLDLVPGLIKTPMTESMSTLEGNTHWDDPALSARLVAAIAKGDHDDSAGSVLDAVELGG